MCDDCRRHRARVTRHPRPATVRYPRDPTLDPQLVWKGKDEQDGHDLEVPAVPIYIGETIDPLASSRSSAPRARAAARRSSSASSRRTAPVLTSGAKQAYSTDDVRTLQE